MISANTGRCLRLDQNEMDFLFDSITLDKPLNYRNKLILELLYGTGIRVSELIQIQIKDINFKNKLITVNYIKYIYDDIEFWLVENDEYFNRDNIYGYEDDEERFLFFSLASAALISKKHVSFDIIHLHDWHTGLIPGILFQEMIVPKFIYTIHNPLFKGNISLQRLKEYYGELELPRKIKNNLDYISMLETGIIMSSKVSTVSPNHSIELLRDERYGLKETLANRGNDFVGILNGIDVKEFNPNKDNYINHNYCVDNVLCYKKENI